eukprot:s1407_g1.t3
MHYFYRGVEARPPNEAEPAGSVHVSFNSVSPNRSFEKHLVLPHCIDGKTIQDVQSKTLTVQLVKLDESQEWGQAWLKPKGRAKRKGENSEQKTGPVDEAAQKAPQEDESDIKVEENDKTVEEKDPSPVETPIAEPVEACAAADQVEVNEEAAAEPRGEVAHASVLETPETSKDVAESIAETEESKEAPAAGDEQNSKAGVKARARRGKKSKASKEKTGESPTPAPMKEETKEEPREVAAERKKAGKKGTESSPAVPAANRSAEVLQDKSTRDALLQALNSVSAPGANDIPVVPPSDPEIHRLVSQGRALLQVDGKKAVVLLRLAARKGYLPAYLLLAEHAQSSQDDTLLIESLCALFTSPDVHKQLPKNVLNTIVMQLTAVLRDPKNRREAEAHAADIDAIAKDWPILHMLKFPPGESKSKTSTAKQQAASKSQAKAVSQDFQKIKSAMASNPPDPPAPVKEALITEIPSPLSGSCKRKEVGFQSVPGSWRQENGRWCISIQANRDDLSTAKLDISHRDLRLTGPDGCWFPSKGRPSTSLKALSFEALLVLPADAIAETLRADLGEAECSVHEVSLPGDGDGLQEAWHQVYTDRCVAQEQSCLLLPGDRAEAFRWLSAMTNWFLGKRPVEFTSEAAVNMADLRPLEILRERLLAKVETPQDLELSQVEASWSKKNHCLEVAGPSVKKVQETPLSPFVDQLD